MKSRRAHPACVMVTASVTWQITTTLASTAATKCGKITIISQQINYLLQSSSVRLQFDWFSHLASIWILQFDWLRYLSSVDPCKTTLSYQYLNLKVKHPICQRWLLFYALRGFLYFSLWLSELIIPLHILLSI